MAEGNGELVEDINQKSDDRGDGERTEDYPKLLEYGLDKKVSSTDIKLLLYYNTNLTKIFLKQINLNLDWHFYFFEQSKIRLPCVFFLENNNG